jgi:hypothetical protein
MSLDILKSLEIKKLNEPAADVAQLVEHILGKDEVTGSIPVVSSRIENRWLTDYKN